MATGSDRLDGVIEGLRRGDSKSFETDGGNLLVEYGRYGTVLELDGMEWHDLPNFGWSKDVGDRVETNEAIARDALRTPPRFSSNDDFGMDPEAAADLIAGMNPM